MKIKKNTIIDIGIKTQHSVLNAVPQSWDWFRLQVYVNDSRASKILCLVRGEMLS